MGKVSTKTTRNVCLDEERVCISVSSDFLSTGRVYVFTKDEKSKEWFGEIDFTVRPEMAKHLGMALIEAAKEASGGTSD